MEKVKILRSDIKVKGDKKWFEISLSDSRKVTGWDDLTSLVNQEVDLEITKVEKGDKTYWNYKLPPKKGVAGAAPKSDRTIALECASRMESNPEEVIKAASLYLTWLKAE
jgi:hypothetical protein